MKLLPDTGWFTALRAWREQRRTDQDPGDLGTAFGLDSITVVDFDSTQAPAESGPHSAADWQRRVARRSSL